MISLFDDRLSLAMQGGVHVLDAITGTDDADSLLGTAGDDVILGKGGNDTGALNRVEIWKGHSMTFLDDAPAEERLRF